MCISGSSESQTSKAVGGHLNREKDMPPKKKASVSLFNQSVLTGSIKCSKNLWSKHKFTFRTWYRPRAAVSAF